MSKVVKIPDSMSPFVVIINGVKQEFPAGVEMEVPDNIAAIIEAYEKGNFPQPAVPATAINMISPGGNKFLLTVDDDGQIVILDESGEKVPEMIVFYIGGKEYKAVRGMTWGEFENSKYNPVFTCVEEGCENTLRAIRTVGPPCDVEYTEERLCEEHCYWQGVFLEDLTTQVTGDDQIIERYEYQV